MTFCSKGIAAVAFIVGSLISIPSPDRWVNEILKAAGYS